MVCGRLLLALALASASLPGFASCEGGVCTTPPSSLPGLRSQVPDPAGLAPVRVVKRDAHPFVNAGPLPDVASLPPLTQASFEIADLQIEQITGANVRAHRASEFHNAVDASGNPFNASRPSRYRSPLLMGASLALLILGCSMLVPMLSSRRRVPSPVDPSPSFSPRPVAAIDAANDLPPIEWPATDASLPFVDDGDDRAGSWSSLVSACGGDVMAAAAAIHAELAADPTLAPDSPLAVERALTAVRRPALSLAA